MSTIKPSRNELIPLTEAANRYGISIQYLRDIARSGRLKANKIGRDWVTTPADVEAYLASRVKKGAYRADLKP